MICWVLLETKNWLDLQTDGPSGRWAKRSFPLRRTEGCTEAWHRRSAEVPPGVGLKATATATMAERLALSEAVNC